MSKKRSFCAHSLQAAELLGKRIRLARKRRRWSEKELAERAGVARATVQKIEAGSMSPAIGLVFELASLVGIKLFEDEGIDQRRQIALCSAEIALLPRHIYPDAKTVDDDF